MPEDLGDPREPGLRPHQHLPLNPHVHLEAGGPQDGPGPFQANVREGVAVDADDPVIFHDAHCMCLGVLEDFGDDDAIFLDIDPEAEDMSGLTANKRVVCLLKWNIKSDTSIP